MFITVCISTVPTFIYYPDPVAYPVAESLCLDAGYNIAMPSSQEKQNILSDYLSDRSINAPVWIGLERDNQSFVWADGSPLTWTSWQDGRPNNDAGEADCVVLRQAEWNDASCLRNRSFVCEIRQPAGD